MSRPSHHPSKFGFARIPNSDDGSSNPDEPTQSPPLFANLAILRCTIAVLSTIICILVFVIAAQAAPSHPAGTAVGFESQDIIPQGATVPREFAEAFNYSDPASHAANVHSLWPSYVAASVRVAVRNPRAYGLSPGFASADGDQSVELYIPAYVHQSHCLRLLRDRYWKYQGSPPPTLSEESRAEIEKEHVHVEHCYDYLRQAILCLGDSTLEGPARHAGGQTSNTDGMGVTHQCRDMDYVRARFRAFGKSGGGD